MATNFKAMGISDELIKIMNENRITKPTPIQVKAIPELLDGKDIIAQAQTGTGKTLAFLLPIMENIDINNPHIQALIITPTRELAIQITNVAKKLATVKNINILAVYGGQDVNKQLRKLKSGIHLVIGTPGRLLDHIRRKSIDLGRLKMLVLDEADEMLNMGFLGDIESIIFETPKRRQTMLFSATIPPQLRSLAAKFMKYPSQIQIESNNITLDEIEQVVVETTERDKFDALCRAVDEYRPFMAIVFCRTKRRVKQLNSNLQNLGYSSDEIHGDLSQSKRERVMKSFRNMDIQLLVATDVAARGLDIEGITHIFNYDIPEDAESYIHRIGRTGRAGQTGIAVTFVTPDECQDLRNIEKKINMTLKTKRISVEKDKKTDTPNKHKRETIDAVNNQRFNKRKKKTKIRNIHKKKK